MDAAAVIGELPPLIKLILDVLKDESSTSRKRCAVLVLGQLAHSTGSVGSLYDTYPTLMPTLFAVLSDTADADLKLECMRVLGILGAVDPYQEKVNRLGWSTKRGGRGSRARAGAEEHEGGGGGAEGDADGRGGATESPAGTPHQPQAVTHTAHAFGYGGGYARCLSLCLRRVHTRLRECHAESYRICLCMSAISY